MKASDDINLSRAKKYESKDQLLAQIWLSIELILFQPCMIGVDYL
jgi:hypothetical protein